MKTVFLDRDGTINVDGHYVHKKSDFHYIESSLNGLKKLSNAGFDLIIITNQSGIGRGFYTENDFHEINNWMVNDLKQKGILIKDVFFCPHLVGSKIDIYNIDCNCRKPKLGLYDLAIKKYNINLDESYAIGDRLRDLSICNVSNCKGYLIGATEDTEIINDVKNGKYVNILYKNNLDECADDILKEIEK